MAQRLRSVRARLIGRLRASLCLAFLSCASVRQGVMRSFARPSRSGLSLTDASTAARWWRRGGGAESVAMSANEMTGGDALARRIQAHQGGPMFGMGGFQLLPFYDAARRLGLAHHLINDERAGVFAADAYAKVSGRVGLVDATLGPGATNLVTGLVEALNAGSPLVAVIGDTHR